MLYFDIRCLFGLHLWVRMTDYNNRLFRQCRRCGRLEHLR